MSSVINYHICLKLTLSAIITIALLWCAHTAITLLKVNKTQFKLDTNNSKIWLAAITYLLSGIQRYSPVFHFALAEKHSKNHQCCTTKITWLLIENWASYLSTLTLHQAVAGHQRTAEAFIMCVCKLQVTILHSQINQVLQRTHQSPEEYPLITVRQLRFSFSYTTFPGTCWKFYTMCQAEW